MVNYWLCVTNGENWEVIKDKGLWGVPRRSRGRIECVRPGDYLVFYVIPGRVCGVFRAVSEPFVSDEPVFSWTEFGRPEVFPYRVRVEPVVLPDEPLEFRSIVPRLRFIRNKVRWSVYLRGAMRSIPKEDYDVIVSSLRRECLG